MLELINISYKVNDKYILNNINLTINEKDFIVITGPNGSGKSTLIKIIMGLEAPSSGKIIYNGKDITNYEIDKRAKLGIGLSFQKPVTFKGLKVSDLLRLSSEKKLTHNEICAYLSEVGLCTKTYLNRDLDSNLSGGELKRIEIASLLSKKGDLLLFDEPEAGIDLWSFQNLIKIFTRLKKHDKRAIVIVSHQEKIIDVADKVILLKDGKVADFTDKDKIMLNLNNHFSCLEGEL